MPTVSPHSPLRRRGFFFAILLSSSAVLLGAEVTTFGPAVELLQPSDPAAIMRAAGSRPILAIEVQRGYNWPEGWLAFAYLKPESEVRGVRRGPIIDLTTLVTDKRAQGWRVTGRGDRYAQVVLPGGSYGESISHTALDRPFRVFGTFSDVELTELVAYIRSSPKMPPTPDDPDGRSHGPPDQLDGHRPLIQLRRVNRSSVEIWLADSTHSGQRATLRYAAGAWHLDQVSIYLV